MTSSAFDRLDKAYEAVGDPHRLETAYENVLTDLFGNPFWKSGPTVLQRVLWTQGERARTEDSKAFGLPGLYLWGAKERPVYIGMTGKTQKQSLGKRLRSRYIGNERSQCNLAKKYELQLREHGIDGFPADIREWSVGNFGGRKRDASKRLRDAVRFAEEGPDKMWFALFPCHDRPADIIGRLEEALIPVGNRRNKHCRLRLLLNEQHKGY